MSLNFFNFIIVVNFECFTLIPDVFIEFDRNETVIFEGQNISLCVLIHSHINTSPNFNVSLLNESKSLNLNITIGEMNSISSDGKLEVRCMEIVVQDDNVLSEDDKLVFALEVQEDDVLQLDQQMASIFIKDNGQ